MLNKSYIKAILTTTLSAMLLNGCGGGSSSNSSNNTGNTDNSTSNVSTAITGSVADGYLIGATVCLDTNLNDECDNNESKTTTTTHGTYKLLNVSKEDLLKYPIIAIADTNTIDEDTNMSLTGTYTLSAAPGQTFISPISSALKNHMFENNVSLETSRAFFATRLNEINPDIISTNYIKTQNQNLHKLAKVIAALKLEVVAKINNYDSTILSNIAKRSRDAYVDALIENKLPDITTDVISGSVSAAVLAQNYSAVMDFTNSKQEIVDIANKIRKYKGGTPVKADFEDGSDVKPTYSIEMEKRLTCVAVFNNDTLYSSKEVAFKPSILSSLTKWYNFRIIAETTIDGHTGLFNDINIFSVSKFSANMKMPAVVKCSRTQLNTKITNGYEYTCKAYSANNELLKTEKTAVYGTNTDFVGKIDYISADGEYLYNQVGGQHINFPSI